MAHPLARPVAVLVAGLLLAGTVQAGPALADPGSAEGLAVSIRVAPERFDVGEYPGDGATSNEPAHLGRVPAGVSLQAVVTNTGTEPIHAIALTNRVLSNGTSSAVTCEKVAWIPRDEPQPEPSDDLVLTPGQSVRCWLGIDGVMEEMLHEDITTVTVSSVDTGVTASDEAHFYATAEDESVNLGDRVWLDSDRDGVQDPGEAGIPGVALTVAGPDGQPARDFVFPGRTIGTQTTGADGSYRFRHLWPLSDGEHYTVTIDPTSPALAGLTPTQASIGDPAHDSSTGSATSFDGVTLMDYDARLDFGFVTPETPPVTPPAPVKKSVTLKADASPEPAIKGSTITVKGSIKRDGKAFKTSAALEFSADGSGTWAKVKTVKSSSKGALSATTDANRSGSFRYRFGGNSTTRAGVSGADHVDVRKATVRLTVSAPGSVTKGKSIKVKGSVKREGKKYRTTTVLEFRRGSDDDWRKVKSVRSSSKGALSTSVKPSASGSYRYRFAGSSTTSGATSRADHVTVKPKPPAKPKPKRYQNCTALTKVYPHGVGRSGAKDKGGDVTDFTRDTKTYNLNTKSDRDKDGIACER